MYHHMDVCVFHLQHTTLLQAVNKCSHTYRLYSESVEIRDLESRGPWAVAAERNEDATKGPRLSKSRISIGRAV